MQRLRRGHRAGEHAGEQVHGGWTGNRRSDSQDHGSPRAGNCEHMIEEAIKGYTIWAAYAAFQEEILGSIEIGKLADFTILDRDILTIEPSEILRTKPIYTIVGGKIRYKAN